MFGFSFLFPDSEKAESWCVAVILMQLMKRISFFVVVSVVPIVESTTIVIALAAPERSGTFTVQHTGRYHYLSF